MNMEKNEFYDENTDFNNVQDGASPSGHKAHCRRGYRPGDPEASFDRQDRPGCRRRGHFGPEGGRPGFGPGCEGRSHGFGPGHDFGPEDGRPGFGPGCEDRSHGFGPEGGRPDLGPGRCPHRFFPEPDSLTGLLMRTNRAMQTMPESMRGSRRVLKILDLAGGSLSQRELQHLLDIQPGSLSELLKKMEAQELLIRERDAEDRRKVTVHLTSKGTAVASQKHGRPDPYSALTEDEQETLRTLLQKLVTSWEPVRDRLPENPETRPAVPAAPEDGDGTL